MTDLERIKEIEEKIGEPIEIIMFEKLSTYIYSDKLFCSFNNDNQITGLLINGNKISDLSFLQEFNKLTLLILNNIKFQNFFFLKEIKSLDSLVLSSIYVPDYASLKELHLISLCLNDGSLSDISFLRELKEIKSLNLSGNRIKDISSLRELKSLSTLYLNQNQINDISQFAELKSLRELYLDSNQISDISRLAELKSLTTLALNDNQISDISKLSELKSLNTLMLSNNQIKDVSKLSELKSLTQLYLNDNQIIEISNLSKLKSLISLDLSFNQIAIIHESIVNLSMEITFGKKTSLLGIDLVGNPVEVPPMEIAMLGKIAILNYYNQIKEQGGTESLYEVKIIIVGEAGSGKTTLFKKLQEPKNEQLPDTSSTLGVEIKEGHLIDHAKEENLKIRANLWDFGGQEIQYQLHQFFITPDSLYILVADNRKQHTRWDYWFQIINLLGGKCSVITVLNNNRTYSTLPNFPIDKCREKFKELDIEQIDIDFKVNDIKWDNLQDIISRKLSQLPIVNKEVPRLWKPLRESLITERETNNYITINRFFEICPGGLDTEEDMLQALNYFHNIGIALHFADDVKLRNTVFLNPSWITNALYAALDGSNEELENGMFTQEWIFEFWQKHKNKYNYEEQTYLLQLMLKDNFDICYEICEGKYIVPMLLPDGKPEYKWNYWDNLGFRIQYPFMPEGIISRLIVRLNNKIKENKVWKEGVLIYDSKLKCSAQIIQKKNYKTGLMFIDIHVDGESLNNKKELLNAIRNEITHIHDTSFPDINNTQLIICNCEACHKLEEPQYFSLNVLKEYLSDSKYYIECRKLKDRVSINNILGNIYSDKEIENMINRLGKGKRDEDITNIVNEFSQEDKVKKKSFSEWLKNIDLSIKIFAGILAIIISSFTIINQCSSDENVKNKPAVTQEDPTAVKDTTK